MERERKVLFVDVGVGIAVIVTGAVSLSPAAVDLWWAGALVALATAVLAWSQEHSVVGGWTTIGLVLAVGLGFIALGLTVGSDAVADVALPIVLVGLGVGMVPYRLYFGLVRPVPDGRLRGFGGGV